MHAAMTATPEVEAERLAPTLNLAPTLTLTLTLALALALALNPNPDPNL